MSLLCDENLPPKLPYLIAGSFPGSVHVRDCGLKGADDSAVWEYARSKGLAIVSKDRDFYERSLLYGAPPKFVWLKVGNCTRNSLLTLLTMHAEAISRFTAESQESVLIVPEDIHLPAVANTITVADAKRYLEKLVERVGRGEKWVLTNSDGKPVAELKPVTAEDLARFNRQ